MIAQMRSYSAQDHEERSECVKVLHQVGPIVNRVMIVNELSNRVGIDRNFKQYYYREPGAKRQGAQWHTPASPKQNKETMSKEFVLLERTGNAIFYVNVLERLIPPLAHSIKKCSQTHCFSYP